MDSIKLPSGAELVITPAPFADSKSLYQAVLEELKEIKVSLQDDVNEDFVKNLFCVGFSSKKIESALEKCMKRATYNGLRIDAQTFEPIEARADYMQVCIEVAKVNIAPFVKGLFAEFSTIMGMVKDDLASRQQTTQS
jgi:hypothetical protein